MQPRHVRIGWAIVIAIVSLLAGIGLGALFGTNMLRYAQNTSALANATVNIAALERLRVGDASGASKILNIYLKSALDNLEANESSLSAAQEKQFAEVRKKASAMQ
jgi:hypothetical protein